MKLWEKGKKLDEEIEAYTVGNDYLYDQKLVKYDCVASKAHCELLFSKKIISKQELNQIKDELDNIIALESKGKFILKKQDEDVHTKIEAHLTKKLGNTGKKIHTLRSRNDQVAVALALYAKENIDSVKKGIAVLTKTINRLVLKNGGLIMPGYTHMQRAMPSTFGVWLKAFAESLEDDIILLEMAEKVNAKNPLGSGAGYGLPIEIDLHLTTKKLGFFSHFKSPLYVQNSLLKKESVAVFALAQIMLSLNKFASDMLLFTTKEFGFFSLQSELCTGSSIMPQKKNYDALEIMRANYSVLAGNSEKIFLLAGNLPSGYNRDVQLAKPALIDSFEITIASLSIAAKIINNLKINEEKMGDACSEELYAAEKATKMAVEGLPFRDAYKKVSKEGGY